MWCGNCHQDVPGVSQSGGRIICSQCQQPMASRNHAANMPICDDGIELTEQPVKKKPVGPPVLPDDWSARRRAKELDRALKRPMYLGAATPETSSLFGARRFDPPQNLHEQALPHGPSIATIEPATTPSVSLQPRSSTASQVFSWLVVTVGIATVASGIGILGWSLSTNHIAHWNLGLSLAIGGQGALIFGLVMVVSRLWRNSRYATSRLQEMHLRLGQLQNTADTISAMRSGGAPTFYADLARSASPQILLSNLKGQVDQLASRMNS